MALIPIQYNYMFIYMLISKVYLKYLIYDAYLIDKYIKGKIEVSVKIPYII